jgi:hypothetical protein
MLAHEATFKTRFPQRTNESTYAETAVLSRSQLGLPPQGKHFVTKFRSKRVTSRLRVPSFLRNLVRFHQRVGLYRLRTQSTAK